MFTIIPAIDLMEGKCVRLLCGDKNEKTVYSEYPLEVAHRWELLGAKRIHIVDLDGAFSGKPANFEIIKKIRNNTNAILEVGGGIRTLAAIKRYIDIGIDKVILGTKAVESLDFLKNSLSKYGDKIIVGIDAKDGNVAVEGWDNVSSIDAITFTNQIEELGVKEIIFTDIKTDGTLSGPNLDALIYLAQSTSMDIIASGGVSNNDDIREIANLRFPNIIGVIVGKALYTNNVDLKKAIEEIENFPI